MHCSRSHNAVSAMSVMCYLGATVLYFQICLSLQVLTNIDVTCPLDWVQHPVYKNKCYRLGDSAVPYSSAPGGCQNLRNGSTVANTYNLEIHKFLTEGLLSPNHEYYTSLKNVGGEYVFTELNNEPLEDWNKWGTITGDTCTVYSNVGGVWYWHTNDCLQPCLYICEYIVPTPGVLPLVLIPVDSIPLSGRVEVFLPWMWGTLRDSEGLETVTIVCKDLGLLVDKGVQCPGAGCGTGRIWYEKVKCSVDSANMSACLADAKVTFPKDHSKDTVARCEAPETTTFEVISTVETTTVDKTIPTFEIHRTNVDESTTAVMTTVNERTTLIFDGPTTNIGETASVDKTTTTETTTKLDKITTNLDQRTTIFEETTNVDATTNIDETTTKFDQTTTNLDQTTILDEATNIHRTTTHIDNITIKIDSTTTNVDDTTTNIEETSPLTETMTTLDKTTPVEETTVGVVSTSVDTTTNIKGITANVEERTSEDVTTINFDETTPADASITVAKVTTSVVTTEPITPLNNVTITYLNFTETVNFTVTETITSYVTIVSSSTCMPVSSASRSLTYTNTSSSIATSTTTDPTTPHIPYVYEALPVLKAKNTAKYSTKTRQDYRPSAQVLGSFGILIIVTILSAIVAVDLGTLGKEMNRVCKRRSRKSNAVPGESQNGDSDMDSTSALSTPRSLTNISINTMAMKTYVEKT